MNKEEQKHGQSQKDILTIDLSSIKIDGKGCIIISDPIVNKKVKLIQKKDLGDQASSSPVVYCTDKLCIDVTCPPIHDNLCGCMPNRVECGCPPIPKPNHGCIPLGKNTKGTKKESM